MISRYGDSLVKAKKVLAAYIKGQAAVCNSGCNHALASAVLTPVESMDETRRALFDVLAS